MRMDKYKYIFGPVPSRRFGRSLGVDLIPFKTCDFNCVFCQLGADSETANSRREYAPISEIEAELKDWCESGGQADVVTLSGSGEPTLHSSFGEIIEFVGTEIMIPTVLLTNSSTMMHPEVREGAAKASIVKASLSAWNQSSFEKINRPAQALKYREIVEGLKDFRRIYAGELRIEVFLLEGYNSGTSEVEKIAKIVDCIGPDLVQLNTAVRPPAEDVKAVSAEQLERLAGLFKTPSYLIADTKFKSGGSSGADQDTILAMIKRHPCTLGQICEIFDIDADTARKHLDRLTLEREIRVAMIDGSEYFTSW